MRQKAITGVLKNAVDIDTIYPIEVVVWFVQNKNPGSLFPVTMQSYIGENKTIRLANSIGSDSIILTTVHLPAHGNNFSGFVSSFDYGAKWTNTTVSHQHFISPALSGGGEMMPANLTQSGPANTMTAGRGTIAILSQSERIYNFRYDRKHRQRLFGVCSKGLYYADEGYNPSLLV
ncbi:hypothetical protein M0J18_RS05305 [Morganella morganii]|nr:hypothetical protein [Morganella morganii]